MAEKIRQMIACGKLYPSDKETLDKMTDIQPDNRGEINAIIVPYGSYKTALDGYHAAYSTVAGKHYDTGIIISPKHKFSFPSIALTGYDKWATPYGDMEIDTEANKMLHSFRSEYIDHQDKPFDEDADAEVQLPFISKGGSSMLMTGFAVGMILSVTRSMDDTESGELKAENENLESESEDLEIEEEMDVTNEE